MDKPNLENKDLLVDAGLLMPSYLASVNPSVVYDLLREELEKEENLPKKIEVLSVG